MSNEAELYLERRAAPRVRYHYTVQFAPNPSLPLRFGKGLTQDVSQRGMQLLCANIPDAHRYVEVWIPGHDDEIIRAKAKLKWSEVEGTYSDNPFWIRCGFELIFEEKQERIKMGKTIDQKIKVDRTNKRATRQKSALSSSSLKVPQK